MKPSQKRKCELFVYNGSLIKKALGNSESYVIPLISEAYSSKDSVFDIKRVLNYINSTNGKTLSSHITTVLISARMSLLETPTDKKMCDIYRELKKRLKKRYREYYIQYAAYVLSEYADTDPARAANLTAKQLESIRTHRKSAYSCKSDTVIASLLSLSDPVNRDEISKDISECIAELKERKVPLKTAKYAARILAFGKGVASARCDRFIRLSELLKDRDAKIGTGKEMAAIAAAALIDIPDETLCDLIAEVNNYLAQSNEFVNDMSEARRVMYSVLLTSDGIISSSDDTDLSLIKEAFIAVILSLESSRFRRRNRYQIT